MRPLIALALLVLVAACSSSEPSGARCEVGRSQSCACLDGGTGAQECSPAGVSGACVCTGRDAGSDATSEAGDAADAGGDVATDFVLIDGAPAPRLYEGCELGDAGSDCGPGLECLAVPWGTDAGTRGVCSVRCPGGSNDECPGRFALYAVCLPGNAPGVSTICLRNCSSSTLGPCPTGTRCTMFSAGGLGRESCAP